MTLGLAITLGGAAAPLLGRIGDAYSLVTTFYVIAGCSAVSAAFAAFLPPIRRALVPAAAVRE